MPIPRRLFCLLLLLAPGCVSSELRVDNVHTVDPGVLIRGAQPDRAGFIALQKTFGIGTVVNLNSDTACSEEPIVRSLGMDYAAVPCNPFAPKACQYAKFLKAVQERKAGKAVYVHCQAGMDRTGTAVGVYRIVVQGWPAERAVDELHQHEEFLHQVLFWGIPSFLREAEKNRAQWKGKLEAAGKASP